MIRGVMKLKGLEKQELSKALKRSMPRAQNATHLDIFILGKERDRLDKEIIIIDKRKASMRRRLDEIVIEMNKLERGRKAGKTGSSRRIRETSCQRLEDYGVTY